MTTVATPFCVIGKHAARRLVAAPLILVRPDTIVSDHGHTDGLLPVNRRLSNPGKPRGWSLFRVRIRIPSLELSSLNIPAYCGSTLRGYCCSPPQMVRPKNPSFPYVISV